MLKITELQLKDIEFSDLILNSQKYRMVHSLKKPDDGKIFYSFMPIDNQTIEDIRGHIIDGAAYCHIIKIEEE